MRLIEEEEGSHPRSTEPAPGTIILLGCPCILCSSSFRNGGSLPQQLWSMFSNSGSDSYLPGSGEGRRTERSPGQALSCLVIAFPSPRGFQTVSYPSEICELRWLGRVGLPGSLGALAGPGAGLWSLDSLRLAPGSGRGTLLSSQDSMDSGPYH